jgi:hypothetical protein
LTTLAAAAFATLATGLAGLFGRELVSCPLLMRRAAALAGDLTLLLLVHRTEAPLVLAFVLLAYDPIPSQLGAALEYYCCGTARQHFAAEPRSEQAMCHVIYVFRSPSSALLRTTLCGPHSRPGLVPHFSYANTAGWMKMQVG